MTGRSSHAFEAAPPVAWLGLRRSLRRGTISSPMVAGLLNSLLFIPAREILATPAQAGLAFEEVAIETGDGERLHGWWVPMRARSAGAHVLLCHGNAGNVGDRVTHAALLCAAGLDVLLFDYRGYGRSSGRPSELGTYRDAAPRGRSCWRARR